MDTEVKEKYTKEELCKDNDDGFKIVDGVLYGYVGCGGEVTVPYGVREVHSFAFKYAEGEIERINLPETLKVIRAAAFYGVKGLKYLSLCSAPDVIDEDLRQYPELKKELCDGIYYLADEDAPYRIALHAEGGHQTLALHPSTEYVCASCFKDLTELKAVDLGNRIKSIPDACFRGCTALTELTLPDSVERVGLYAFDGCTALTRLALPEGLRVLESGNRDTLLRMAKKDGVGVYFPIEKNERGVLLDYSSQRIYLELPEGVTVVTDYALKKCESAFEIRLPKSLKSFSYSAKYFYSLTLSADHEFEIIGAPFNCENHPKLSGYSLKSFHSELDVRPYDKEVEEFKTRYGTLELYRGKKTEVKIPEDVKVIGNGAFRGRDDITGVEFPEGVESIRENAFKGCTGICGEVRLPSTVKYIEPHAFDGCKGIGRLLYPKSATLAKGAFAGLGLFKAKKY